MLLALNMVFANDIRLAILRVAENRGKHSFTTDDVARELDANNWKGLEDQVRFVADVLVREGKLTRIQSDKPLDNGIVNPLFRKT